MREGDHAQDGKTPSANIDNGQVDVVVFVGNGFDLACSLPTTYGDFLSFAQEQLKDATNTLGLYGASDSDSDSGASTDAGASNNAHAAIVWYTLLANNVWLEHFTSDDITAGNTWVDFEAEIARVIRGIENNMRDVTTYGSVATLDSPVRTKVVTSKGVTYDNGKIALAQLLPTSMAQSLSSTYTYTLRDIVNNDMFVTLLDGLSYKHLKDALLADLNRITLAFELYLSECVERGAIRDGLYPPPAIETLMSTVKDARSCHVLTFNYTNTFEELSRGLFGDDTHVAYCHIHGEVEWNIQSVYEHVFETCSGEIREDLDGARAAIRRLHRTRNVIREQATALNAVSVTDEKGTLLADRYIEKRERSITSAHRLGYWIQDFSSDPADALGCLFMATNEADDIRIRFENLTRRAKSIATLSGDNIGIDIATLQVDTIGLIDDCLRIFIRELAPHLPESGLVLGMDEYLPSSQDDPRGSFLDFIEFRKYYQRIYKEASGAYVDWLHDIERAYAQQENIHERCEIDSDGRLRSLPILQARRPIQLHIFGHSLGITDGDVIRQFVTSDAIRTTCYYHDRAAFGSQLTNMTHIIGRDTLIGMTGGTERRLTFTAQDELVGTWPI